LRPKSGDAPSVNRLAGEIPNAAMAVPLSAPRARSMWRGAAWAKVAARARTARRPAGSIPMIPPRRWHERTGGGRAPARAPGRRVAPFPSISRRWGTFLPRQKQPSSSSGSTKGSAERWLLAGPMRPGFVPWCRREAEVLLDELIVYGTPAGGASARHGALGLRGRRRPNGCPG